MIQWATKLLQCFVHLHCLANNPGYKIAENMTKYVLEAQDQASRNNQYYYVISTFGIDMVNHIRVSLQRLLLTVQKHKTRAIPLVL